MVLKVMFLFTSLCNLRCKHCYVNTNFYKSLETPIELKKKVFERILKEKPYFIDFVGGDPLIFKEILVEWIEKAINSGVKYLAVSTNGTLINNSFLNKVERYKDRLSFSISLDYPPKFYEKLRGVKFINTYKKIKEIIERGFDVTIYMVFNKENVNKIVEGVNYYYSTLGIKNYVILPIIKSGLAKLNKIYAEKEDVIKLLKELREKEIPKEVKVHLMCIPSIKPFLNKENIVIYTCSYNSSSNSLENIHDYITILGSGHIIGSCDVYPILVGNILDIPIGKLKEFYLNNLFIKYFYNISDICKNCPFLKECKGGCPARKMISENNVDYLCLKEKFIEIKY